MFYGFDSQWHRLFEDVLRSPGGEVRVGDQFDRRSKERGQVLLCSCQGHHRYCGTRGVQDVDVGFGVISSEGDRSENADITATE